VSNAYFLRLLFIFLPIKRLFRAAVNVRVLLKAHPQHETNAATLCACRKKPFRFTDFQCVESFN